MKWILGDITVETPIDSGIDLSIRIDNLRVFINKTLSTERLINQLLIKSLDAKTGLLTGLLAGKQGWKCPVPLLATCCGSKSLKVILIDSDFRAYPVLSSLVTL